MEHLWLWTLPRSRQSLSELPVTCSADTRLKPPWPLLLSCPFCSGQMDSNRPVSTALPGNQAAPRVTPRRGRHHIRQITASFHEVTINNGVLNTYLPRASIIHYTALPPNNQIYWLDIVLTSLLWMNRTFLTVKVQLSPGAHTDLKMQSFLLSV